MWMQCFTKTTFLLPMTHSDTAEAGELLTFGKHKGERWTRVPKSYLRWLANEGTQYKQKALEELKRRGTTVTHDIELSAHAVDRASLRLEKQWKTMRKHDEGIYSWLERMAKGALEIQGILDEGEDTEVIYSGMKFCFSHGDYYPCLKSVFPK